jgi:hypothetical protein
MFSKIAGVTAAIAVGASVTVAGAQNAAVQWKVSEGGNGHWYEGVIQNGVTWTAARAAAQARGGELASLSTFAESEFAFTAVASAPALWNGRIGPWIGLTQLPNSIEPDQGWVWLDGSALSDARWVSGHPLNGWGGGPTCEYAHYTAFPTPPANTWGVDPNEHYPTYHLEDFRSYLIEYSADCNNDGIVDYGQILTGALGDTNANNIPDCCEGGSVCVRCVDADVIETGVIDAVDLAAVISAWGTDGGKYPRADIDGSGEVDAADLTAILTYWGPCGE